MYVAFPHRNNVGMKIDLAVLGPMEEEEANQGAGSSSTEGEARPGLCHVENGQRCYGRAGTKAKIGGARRVGWV